MKHLGVFFCLLLGQTTVPVVAEDRFFPNAVFDEDADTNQFHADWYREQLEAMKEPSIWKQLQSDPKTNSYRFLYLPSFDRPIAVRITKPGEQATLHVVQLDRALGDKPGKIIFDKSRRLTQTEWEWVHVYLEKAKFWTLPTVLKLNLEDGTSFDADKWIYEGTNGEAYHIVDRNEPNDAKFKTLCMYMLELAGISTEWPYFPDRVLDPDEVKRYSNRLKAMEEPSLRKIAENGESQVYRFLWMPSRQRTVSVRILRFGELDGRAATLEHVELDGDEPGIVVAKKTRKLDQKAWDQLIYGLDEIKFWTLSTKDKRVGPANVSQILVEGVDQNKYHVIERTDQLHRDLLELFERAKSLGSPNP